MALCIAYQRKTRNTRNTVETKKYCVIPINDL